MAEMRDRLDAPMLVGVGAAFDFHAGLVPQAPPWMQRRGPGVDVPPGARAAPAVARATRATTRASSPASRGQYARHRLPAPRDRSLSRHAADVSVIGLGRVGLPLALSFADRGLTRHRRRQRPRAARRRSATAACPSTRPAPQEALDARCIRRPAADLSRPRRRCRRWPSTSSSRSERRRSRTSRSTCGDIRSALDDLLPLLRAGHALIAALDDRPGHDRLRRRLPRQAPRLRPSARTSSSPTAPSGSPPGASSRRSTRCRASSAASASAPARSSRACSRSSARRSCRRRRCRPSSRRSGRTSSATRTFALPNLLMMDCEQYGANVFDVIDLINRDYPRGGMALPGLHRRHLPAQGLHVLRGALQRPGHAARGLARQRVRAAASSSRASSAGSAR